MIVVGVDGSDESKSAYRLDEAESGLRGRDRERLLADRALAEGLLLAISRGGSASRPIGVKAALAPSGAAASPSTGPPLETGADPVDRRA